MSTRNAVRFAVLFFLLASAGSVWARTSPRPEASASVGKKAAHASKQASALKQSPAPSKQAASKAVARKPAASSAPGTSKARELSKSAEAPKVTAPSKQAASKAVAQKSPASSKPEVSKGAPSKSAAPANVGQSQVKSKSPPLKAAQAVRQVPASAGRKATQKKAEALPKLAKVPPASSGKEKQPATKSTPRNATSVAKITARAVTPSTKVTPPSAPVVELTPPPKPSVPGISFAELNRLGSISVGRPNTGYLVNAVRMPENPDWVLTAPSHGWGTRETVDQLEHCLHQVHEQYPGSPPVMLGSLSAQFGGKLPPHKSHRTGRDADVYFFRTPDATWNRRATKQDIDLPRTWAMLKCFVTESDVDMVLIDYIVQGWLEAYALSAGEPEEWVHSLFHDRQGSFMAPVRHVPGHVAHMHVRFVSPEARRRGVQNYDRLVASGIVAQGMAPVRHTVAKGDTLLGLAKRYNLGVEQIRANNQLKNSTIRIGQVLLLQQAVELEGAHDPVWIPPRRVPTKHDPVAPELATDDPVTLRTVDVGEAEISGS